jgi:hypothetical protein
MNQYYIDIVDTVDGTQTLVEEKAKARSIVLNWNGSDEKDKSFIIGSSMFLDLLAPNNSMGHFIHLFTASETRYRFDFKNVEDDSILWQGFLIPDTYQEPFTNSTPFIRVTASDGLGRLKGKYLPDDFYTKEVSVIQVIQNCLAQTGLNLDLYFAPAIQHITFQKYHNIYIDGTLLVEKEKKQTCYTILQNLMESMVCKCYQHLGAWYVEGLNIRHLDTVKYDKYVAGTGENTYEAEVEKGRNIKVAEGDTLVTPLVTMVPVYKTVRVEYDIEQPKLPENIVQETNDGWASEVFEFIYADAFFPHNGESFVVASAFSEYKVRFLKDYSVSPDTTRYMSLIKPVYVDVNQEVAVELNFKSSIMQNEADKTSMKVQLVLNEVVLFETTLFNDPNIEDEDEQSLTYIKEAFVIDTSGYFDVYVFLPISDGRNSIMRDGWELTTFKINVINQDATFLIEDTVNDDFSIEKEVTLTYADEFSGLNPSFLLAKLNDGATETYQQNITVYNEFESGGFTYLQVKLKDANLCDEFKNNVYANGNQIQVIEVIYNWLGSLNEHMVKLAAPVNGVQVYVELKKNFAGAYDRSTWQSWTDAVYNIENERYGKIVANVYRRMFLEPYEKIDLTVKKLINFHDLVLFKYIDLRRYVVTNTAIDLDAGETTITMVLNYYHDNSGGTSENIAPILNLPDDFCIGADVTYITIDFEAYDPDGFIVTYLWELVSGDAEVYRWTETRVGIRAMSLNDSEFVFRCTVTDNGGASVSKEITICRVSSAELQVSYQCGIILNNDSVPPPAGSSTPTGTTYRKGVLFDFLNTVSNNYNFNVKLKVEALLCSAMTMDDALDELCSVNYTIEDRRLWRLFGGGIRVFKNGIAVGSHVVYHPDRLDTGFVEFAMNPSDTILIMVYGYQSSTTYLNTKVTVESITEINDAVEVSNEGLEFYLTETYTLQ